MMKKIILILLAVIALPFVIALFLKKEYHVERSAIINGSKTEVFNFLKYLNNQEKYSPWQEIDPTMKKTFTGTDGEVGYILRWESENDEVGIGEQEISALKPYDRIDYKFRFYKPFEALTDTGYFNLEEVSSTETKVIWGFDGNMKYPMNIMGLLMDFDTMIGESFEDGLSKIQTIFK